ncbi:replication initiation protein [Candidatus Magnetominusculus xianensis]|uniref:Replication protein n=1 Tax=Candidatus Magnetominusculus xianensis TaxID=1748249 RepID=A0ABR5SGJ9_9BACT|nr:replication initiation protein [Candidatus Magnetominusculus xianensis]KWT85465.1 replication protein [Candidatus Magnetominusculus xianensis]MBF0402280.1 replication initiation protein [Magnetococcales bacterium]
MAKKNLKQLVVKSNELIEAHYRLSLNEQKIILCMISKIKPDDKDFTPIRISVEELTAMLDVSGKYHAEIRKLANSLRHRDLHIHNPQEEFYLDTSWLSASKYYYGKGYLELEFSAMLKPYLLELRERFTAYQLQNVIRLNSLYSIRLYELLKQYGKIGKREFEVIELRKILGIADNEYKLYNDFKRNVILTAQTELSAKTDLQFTFDEKKTGRAVTGLIVHVFTRLPEPPTDSIAADFTITDQYDLAVSKLPEYERGLFQRLQKTYLLSKKQAHEIVTVYLPRDGKERIESVLDYCHTYHKKALKVDRKAHLGAITWTALKEVWQVQPELFQEPVKKSTKIEISQEPTPEERAEVKKLLAEWRQKYDSH